MGLVCFYYACLLFVYIWCKSRCETLIKYLSCLNSCWLIYDVFTFPIVNFPFISSNIPAAPAHGLTFYNSYIILGLVAKILTFWTQKLLKQDYIAPRVKSSLQNVYISHYKLVDCYEIAISQMAMDLLPFYVDFFLSLLPTRLLSDLNLSNTVAIL